METELQALRAGLAAVVSLPGEVFVELGHAVKRASPFRPDTNGATLIAVLANDYVGYIATRRAIEAEGGYETWATSRAAAPPSPPPAPAKLWWRKPCACSAGSLPPVDPASRPTLGWMT